MYRQTVLSIHNFYRQPGGEDRVFADEATLLEQHGHTVVRYEEHNQRIAGAGIAAAGSALWSNHSFRQLRSMVQAQPSCIAHFHNTFPLISPAGYFAARAAGLPVVQTLHNYRLICANGTLVRDGAVCGECVERGSLLPALIHGCYRGSRPATAAVITMLAVHRAGGTWRRMVNVYIALSEFARGKFIEAGLPPAKIVVKPNFLGSDPGIGNPEGSYALFVGRLAQEKGVHLLAQAWQKLPGIPLIVAGEGPLNRLEWPGAVKVIGSQSRQQVFSLMRDARVLIFPSICYEGSPLAVIEALACGLPVIASNLGSVPEYVTHRKTGLLFQPNDVEDLTKNVVWAFEHPEELRAMRFAARGEYEQKYTAERNYKMLTDIYAAALGNTRLEVPFIEPVA